MRTSFHLLFTPYPHTAFAARPVAWRLVSTSHFTPTQARQSPLSFTSSLVLNTQRPMHPVAPLHPLPYML